MCITVTGKSENWHVYFSISISLVNTLFARCVHNNVVKLRCLLSFQNTQKKLLVAIGNKSFFFIITNATKLWTFDDVLHILSLLSNHGLLTLLCFVKIFSYFPTDLTKSENVTLSHANNLTVRRRNCLSHERWRTVRFEGKKTLQIPGVQILNNDVRLC